MLVISEELLGQLNAHGQETYPREGAGFLLGQFGNGIKTVSSVMPLVNRWDLNEQYHRFILTDQDWQKGEAEAEHLKLELIGCFHSHPDHPAEPSEFDCNFAMPNFIYVITSVEKGRAVVSRAWLLKEDHSGFDEEQIELGAT